MIRIRRFAGGSGLIALLTLLLAGTPAAAQCVGDCDENHRVAVNELIVGVNIALQRATVADCASLDTDGDARVAINELIGAVNNALRGCGFAGRYSAAVDIDGSVGAVDLLAAGDGTVRGTVTIGTAAARPALLISTVVDVAGSFDPATGAFEVTGTFRAPDGMTFDVRLAGQLGGPFTLAIGDRTYDASFAADGTPTPTATPRGATHVIRVGQPGLPFDPEVLEIDPGDEVVWAFAQGSHSVRAATLDAIGLPSCAPSGLFSSSVGSPGGEIAYLFTVPGRYGYHCGVPGHCEAGETGYIDVRGTPSPTPTRTATASPTVAVPTAPPTPDTIGGVSTRLLGFFSGTASVGTFMQPARLQIQVNDGVVTVLDLSEFPNVFPNPVQMSILSATSVAYESSGPPPISFTLSLNEAGHVVGSYTVTDPIMPHLPIAFDLVREP